MKKQIIIALTILSMVACAKKDQKKQDPMAPIDKSTDSAELQAAKKSAQDKNKEAEEKLKAEAAAKKSQSENGLTPPPATGSSTPPNSNRTSTPPMAYADDSNSATATGVKNESTTPTTVAGGENTPPPPPPVADTSAQTTPTAPAPAAPAPAAPAPAAPAPAAPAAGSEATTAPATPATPTTPTTPAAAPTNTSTDTATAPTTPVTPTTPATPAAPGTNTGTESATTPPTPAANPGTENTTPPTSTAAETGAADGAGASAGNVENPNEPQQAPTSQEPTSTTTTTTALTSSVAAPEIDRTYSGDLLTLSYKNKADWGRIRLEGPDAQKLYESLRVQETFVDGNKDWDTAKVKTGASVQCFRQAPKLTPRNFGFSCVFFIDYKQGISLAMTKQVMPNDRVRELRTDYKGGNLFLNSQSKAKLSELKLKGTDAKALYSVLTAEATVVETKRTDLEMKGKTGMNFVCYEATVKASGAKVGHACSVYFNFENGKVLRLK
jgi:hypothetical protein